MAQRWEPSDSLDDFPTPPWATRALMEHVFPHLLNTPWSRPLPHCKKKTVWEPAANRGFMSRPLSEYFSLVYESDIADYGRNYQMYDFARETYEFIRPDWIVTNPPFNLAAEFIQRAYDLPLEGFAFLCRTSILEGVKRFREIYSKYPPTIVAPFVERVPMFRGRVDPKGSTATSYCWLVWKSGQHEGRTDLIWIPPCRNQLEKPGDYDV